MEDDPLYAELYGGAPPAMESRRSAAPAAPALPPPALFIKSDDTQQGPPKSFAWSRNVQKEAPEATELAQSVVESDGDELEVKLDVPAEEDDELDIELDETRQTAFQTEEAVPSSFQQDARQGGASPGPASSLPLTHTQPGAAPPRPAFGGPPASGFSGTRPPLQSYPSGPAPRPQLDLPPAFPQQAQPGQKIKLPGQSRVPPEEYREFLVLGHGGVFDLDVDNVVDAPWKAQGADPRDFFNYNLNMMSWREYCRRMKQLRSESVLQRKIQTYEGASHHHANTAGLPPELVAALAAEAESERAARAATPTFSQLPMKHQPAHIAARPHQSNGTHASQPPQEVAGSDADPPAQSLPGVAGAQAGSGPIMPVSAAAFPSLMEDGMFGVPDLVTDDSWQSTKRMRMT